MSEHKPVRVSLPPVMIDELCILGYLAKDADGPHAVEAALVKLIKDAMARVDEETLSDLPARQEAVNMIVEAVYRALDPPAATQAPGFAEYPKMLDGWTFNTRPEEMAWRARGCPPAPESPKPIAREVVDVLAIRAEQRRIAGR